MARGTAAFRDKKLGYGRLDDAGAMSQILYFVTSRGKRTNRKQSADLTPRRQFMQIAVPFILPAFCIGALGSLLKLEHPLLALAVSPLALAGGLVFGYYMRVAAKTAAAASARAVPRWRYGLGGLCFLALTVVVAQLSYAESHSSGNEAFSITLGFLAVYCAIGGVLHLGRALGRGRRRLLFWVFLPRWMASELKPDPSRRSGRNKVSDS
jgi:hypothetical protein